MAARTSAQHVFMFLWIIGSVAAGVLEVKAKPGENVTLPCNSQTDAAVTKLVWSRSELKDVNIFFFRDGRLNENQDPRYRGRVELKDPQMKNGDFSVLLKSVTVDDSGTYQCQVTPPNMPTELLRSVHLSVSEGPEPFPWWGVALLVVCSLLVVVVVGFALKRYVFPKLDIKWSAIGSR